MVPSQHVWDVVQALLPRVAHAPDVCLGLLTLEQHTAVLEDALERLRAGPPGPGRPAGGGAASCPQRPSPHHRYWYGANRGSVSLVGALEPLALPLAPEADLEHSSAHVTAAGAATLRHISCPVFLDGGGASDLPRCQGVACSGGLRRWWRCEAAP